MWKSRTLFVFQEYQLTPSSLRTIQSRLYFFEIMPTKHQYQAMSRAVLFTLNSCIFFRALRYLHWERDVLSSDSLTFFVMSRITLSCFVFFCLFFLAATKQLYEWYFPSVCLSVCLSHLIHYVPIIVSSWIFQELLTMTNVMSMQKVKVRGQRSRSQRSKPNLTVSGL